MHPNFKEFTIGDHVYRCGKMDARTQFHVSRRILPILLGLANGEESGGMAGQMKGAATALASLPDVECDYVISKCMGVVQRKLAGDAGWTMVWSPAGDRPMMDDIDMVVMLQIVGEVLAHNLQNFTQGLPSGFMGLMQSPSDMNQ